MVLYLRGELGLDAGTTQWLYALLLVGAVVGPLLAGMLSDRFGRRPNPDLLLPPFPRWASCSSWPLARISGCWPRCCCRSAPPCSASRRSCRPTSPTAPPARSCVAFSVYFTFAFGIGGWAFVIGNVVSAWGYPVAFGVMAASYLAAALLLLAMPRALEPLSLRPKDSCHRSHSTGFGGISLSSMARRAMTHSHARWHRSSDQECVPGLVRCCVIADSDKAWVTPA